MRIVTWNLNHRAARRKLPLWVVAAIGNAKPDVLMLTEYVSAADHSALVDVLNAFGLPHTSVSARPERQNQVLIATRQEHFPIPIAVPTIHEAVPSNILRIRFQDGSCDVWGFRMPAFKSRHKKCKRQTWDWLTGELQQAADRPGILAGDFNTAPWDSDKHCGDALRNLPAFGWHHAGPTEGCTWRSHKGGERHIDHVFVTEHFEVLSAGHDWNFQRRYGPEAADGRVGRPDHAMVMAEVAARNQHSTDPTPTRRFPSQASA